MNRIMTPRLWFLCSLLWLLPIATEIIYDQQGRNPWLGIRDVLLPLVVTLAFAACNLFPNWWFRREEDYPIIRKAFAMGLIIALYACVAMCILIYSQGRWLNLYQKIGGYGAGLFFILLGNIMPKLRRNRAAGIRYPWTMTNDEVWRKVHYWGGIETVILGVLLMIATYIFPVCQIPLRLVTLILILTYVAVVTGHSYLIARSLKSLPNSNEEDAK